jgi:two-component system response regulator DesR
MRTNQDVCLANQAQKPPGLLPAGQSSCGVHRVWLVDDDDEFRRLLGQLLNKVRGMRCPRGFAAPELLLNALQEETPPETILLDVHLRHRNGIDFIRPIRALAPGTRVIMLSTFYETEHARRALHAGASRFLVKTSSIGEIVQEILEN